MINAVLVLVGPVGSGKSTFADSLVRHGAAKWSRVNQDVSKSRKGCEVALREGLICVRLLSLCREIKATSTAALSEASQCTCRRDAASSTDATLMLPNELLGFGLPTNAMSLVLHYG